MAIVNSKGFQDLSVRQIVPRLADEGVYVASEATIYRILQEEDQLTHRGRTRPPQSQPKPQEHVATAPCQVWSWDITYLRTQVAGLYYYLYLILDVYSRKIVGWEVHEREDGELSRDLVAEAIRCEGANASELVLHADNGGPMRASTLISRLERLGVAPSFSRPGVCDDNPFSEALFRTMKYHPGFPARPFASLQAARAWVEAFVAWYNEEHRHSGIEYVTPNQRHTGQHVAVLEKRQRVYEAAKRRHPNRWGSRPTRNWTPTREVYLNPDELLAR
jgi:transposase InsO family protein